jgi:hypothetical protein
MFSRVYHKLSRHRIIPGTPGRSYPVSGISYEKIVQEKDPGNATQSARSARSARTCRSQYHERMDDEHHKQMEISA